MPSLYDTTVPAFIGGLTALSHILTIGEKYAKDNVIPETDFTRCSPSTRNATISRSKMPPMQSAMLLPWSLKSMWWLSKTTRKHLLICRSVLLWQSRLLNEPMRKPSRVLSRRRWRDRGRLSLAQSFWLRIRCQTSISMSQFCMRYWDLKAFRWANRISLTGDKRLDLYILLPWTLGVCC